MADISVLIVEDDEHIRRHLAGMLKEWGVEAEAVGDGETALARILRQEYSLALVDINLPGIDGLTVLRRSRTLDPSLPVVIMTADQAMDRVQLARNLGAADFIFKPFAPERIRELLNIQRVPIENAADCEAMLRKGK